MFAPGGDAGGGERRTFAGQEATANRTKRLQRPLRTEVVWDDRIQRAAVEPIEAGRLATTLDDEGRRRLVATGANPEPAEQRGADTRPLIAVSAAPQRDPREPGAGACESSPDNEPLADRRLDDSKIVADVRENFIALIRYNRLQCFQLGVLIYSVINLILILNSITATDWSRSKLSSISAVQAPDGLRLDDGSSNGVGAHAARLAATSCASELRGHMLTGWVLIVFLLPATLLLIANIALSFLEFQSVDWKLRETHRPTRSQRLLTSVGVVLGLVLLLLPISTVYLGSLVRGAASGHDCNESADSKSQFGPHSIRPPVSLIVITVYLLPYLLDEVRWHTKLLCICLVAAPVLVRPLLEPGAAVVASAFAPITHPSEEKPRRDTSDNLPLSDLCWALGALVVGLIRRQQLNRFTRQRVFDGATESIEAKVSLEQQRQQQETLLLSVLPAYVAEQVKRNMVKKMLGGQHQEIEQLPAAGPPAPPSSPASHANCVAAATVAEAPGGGAMQCAPSNEARARHSRLGSSTTGEPNAFGPAKPTGILSHEQQQGLHTSSNLNINFLPAAPSPAARRGFNELYIRTYNNVSLLYGDIVGFTQLCTQLSSWQLVGVLNDLFSHFDQLAERNKIMRIKILGDCYYGVSGIPEFAVMGAKSRAKSSGDNHAINCVNMGLDMIQYIKCLNVRHSIWAATEQQQQQNQHQRGSISASTRLSFMGRNAGAGPEAATKPRQQVKSCLMVGRAGVTNTAEPADKMPAFELNMRIGVHTGHIHSGVIGLKKWQFDIWSNDVSIAMHCESSGVAGRVQVTEATVQHLHGSFEFEPSPCSGRDQLLAEREIKTYLISDRSERHGAKGPTSVGALVGPGEAGGERAARPRTQANRKATEKGKQDESAAAFMNEDKIREATIGTIRETLLAGETCNSNPSNGYALALDHNDLGPASLQFSESTLERSFARRPICIESHSVELFVLFLLLAVAVSCLNLQYGQALDGGQADGAGGWLKGHLVSVSFATVVSLSLLVNLALSLRAGNAAPHSGEMRKASSGSGRLASEHHPNRWHVVDVGEQNFIARKLSQASRVSARLNPRSLLRRTRTSSFEAPQGRSASRLSSLVVLFAYSVVIVEQACIIWSRAFCGWPRAASIGEPGVLSNDTQSDVGGFSEHETSPSSYPSGDSNGTTLVEHYQLTVLLILAALDLCVNTISYKAKFRFLLAIAAMQLAVLVLDPVQSMASASHESPSPSASWLQPTCGALVGWPDQAASTQAKSPHEYRDSSAPTVQPRPNERQGGGRQHQQQQLINRSTDALLLVLALWSLAFARQLEYTNRTNFLWRNRLNVDHEELEYISGINKVLLENILPSHVVHHYLSQPTSATAGAATASGQTLATNEPRLKGANNSRVSLTKSSSAELMRLNLHQMRNLHDELYHEQHDSVAVMFASIPHFYEFYDESDISKQGLGCIALLNEIICDFDRLLLKNKFSRIEKIKTIGSTYMAAAGLRPCHLVSSRNSAASQLSQQLPNNNLVGSPAALSPQPSNAGSSKLLGTPTSEYQKQLHLPLVSPQDERKFILSQQKLNLMCMIQFASSLMSALNGINKQSFQVFKLRVGINTGPVIAGVIGSQRPFYDIWGDCVNIASRMESLGEIGRIQVEEQTAQLLMECLCADTYTIVRRGPINVKGKGGMVTYFVDKKQTGPHTSQSIGITTFNHQQRE